MSMYAICKKYKIPSSKCRKILKKNKIPIRNLRESQQHIKRKYALNEEYFHDLNSEEKAYWLGFISADGNISAKNIFQMSLHIKDDSHIQKFKKSINSEHKINTRKLKTKYGETEISEIRFSSKKFVEGLKKQGILERKTFKELEVPDMENCLCRHYWRGYFDGDGSISKLKNGLYEFGFSGNIFAVERLQSFIKSEINISLNIHKDKSIYRIRCGGNKKPYKVLSLLYNKSDIYLDRKYELYKQLEESIAFN